MKEISLSKNGSLKALSGNAELYKNDFEEAPKRLISGEWCLFVDTKKNIKYIGYSNIHANERAPIAMIVETFSNQSDPVSIIEKNIQNAIKYRKKFNDIELCGRLVFGENDRLPGLVVDGFLNKVVIQINSMGMDNYRDQIKNIVEKETGVKAFFLDNKEYREREGLPVHDTESCELGSEVIENNLKFFVKSTVEQKLGHYYDHRENRSRLKNLIKKFNGNLDKGLDLFCYSGAWGIYALSGGLKSVDFVDQGNFEETVRENLKNNQFDSNNNIFIRSDVFSFLNKMIDEGKKYNVILSDPPAFAKSSAMKRSAIEGYKKLNDKIFQLIESDGLISISSCTKYVSYEELDQTVQEAARKNKREIRLIDHGQQGLDHPIKSLDDKSHYIKYLAYWVG